MNAAYFGVSNERTLELLCMSMPLVLSILNSMSYLLFVIVSNKGAILSKSLMDKTIYNRAALTFDYSSVGFVRRGLGGSITALFGSNFFLSGIEFHIITALWLSLSVAVFMIMLYKRVPTPVYVYTAAVVLFSPQMLLGWSTEIMKTDLLVEGCIIWAAMLSLYGYSVLSGSIILFASLAHETALVFGAPLILVLNLGSLSVRYGNFRRALQGAATLITGLALISACRALWPPSSEALLATYARTLSQWGAGNFKEGIQVAAYFNIAGFRGVKAAVCENLHDSRYGINVAYGAIIIVLYAYILRIERKWKEVAIVAMLPYIFMVVVATDTGRWLKFAVGNVCWLGIVLATQQATAGLDKRRGVVGMLVLLLLLATGLTHYSVVSYASDKLMNKMGVPRTKIGWAALDECDATWREVLDEQ